jgi:hypothetical protein
MISLSLMMAGPDVRRHDDLRAEGGAPGAEGAGQAQRRGRDDPECVAGVARGVRARVQERRGRGGLSRGGDSCRTGDGSASGGLYVSFGPA